MQRSGHEAASTLLNAQSLPQYGYHAEHPPACQSLSATIYRFVSEPKQARRYFVSGIVQGVGFRYFSQHAAERLRLTGYAKNLPDGRVEVYAIGTGEHLAKLRSALERGPWGASVSEVKEEDASIDSNDAGGFVITY